MARFRRYKYKSVVHIKNRVMPINRFISYTLTSGQSEAIRQMESFFRDDRQIYVLQGYAGTGKTTLLKGILDYLDAEKRPYKLMASTGRAARVLTNKTGRSASTIHSTIYEIDSARTDVQDDRKVLAFRLRQNQDAAETLYFIDEASMIADKTEMNQNLLFDDGRFLDHILRYIGRRKIIFVGDSAQLPPVNCSFSAAMDADYLERTYHRKVTMVGLTEVKRQEGFGGIITNATQLREKLNSGTLPPVSLKISGFDDIMPSVNIWKAVKDYSVEILNQGFESEIFISYSNGGAHYLNSEIRRNIYKNPDTPLQADEWLMVIQNNYQTGYNNGQHLRLLNWNNNGEKVGNISLVDAEVEDPQTGISKSVKLVYDLLFRKDPNLTLDEEKEFTKDFAIRMRHMGIKPGTDSFLVRLISDKRLNALRVKFGYAITCHKAQGGEWDKVYMNIEPALEKMPRDLQYRWLYTAITRAASYLVVPNHPILY
ncbi:MAG TPA: AAA family ATPase [Syntrophomonas sp.]|nr:AAA family ATPase [Syntrophomonas sp.]